MIDLVPLCSLADLDRFKLMCQDAIDAGELEKLKKFPIINARDLKRRQKEAEKEEIEAEKAAKSSKSGIGKGKKDGNLDDLKQMMMASQKVLYY